MKNQIQNLVKVEELLPVGYSISYTEREETLFEVYLELLQRQISKLDKNQKESEKQNQSLLKHYRKMMLMGGF